MLRIRTEIMGDKIYGRDSLYRYEDQNVEVQPTVENEQTWKLSGGFIRPPRASAHNFVNCKC